MTQSYELDEAIFATVHELRKTRKGIRHLKETGKFRAYMDQKQKTDRRFVAWDGEGWTDTDGEHRYMLMQASTGHHIEYPRLDTRGCLDLIISVAAQTPDSIHVIFGGGYDVTHIVRDMPVDLRDALLTGEAVTYSVPAIAHVAKRNRYTLEYLPHKWFIVSGFDWNTGKTVRVKIYDVMTFFQSSFIKALKAYKMDVPEIIASGKAARSDFTFADLDDIKIYCQMELELLVMLCDQLRDDFRAAGFDLTTWHGPGAVASAVFKAYGMRSHMREPEPHIEEVSQYGYFGGRFECFKAGHYSGRVFQYDIRSAYPNAIRYLPSLNGGEWEERTQPTTGGFGIWRCVYDNGSAGPVRPNATPWRGDGGIVAFPASNSLVWLWTPEAMLPGVTVLDGYEFIPLDDSKPFAFVEGMYTKRKEWKRNGKGAERALKLALNSLYGKMAQRVGGSERYNGRPPWHQLEWAGYVTSFTRAYLFGAMLRAADGIIAVETDAVFTTRELDLPVSDQLGDWECTEYEWITYLQSGVYWTNDSSGLSDRRVKSRGFNPQSVEYADVERYLRAYPDVSDDDRLYAAQRQFIALGNPQRGLYGQWQDSAKEIRIGGGKRIHVPEHCGACDRGESFAESLHDLSVPPWTGISPSAKHTLPWRDSEEVLDPEMEPVELAIEEYDVARRIR